MESNKVQPFVAQEVGLSPTMMKTLNISDPEMVVKLAKEVKRYVDSQGLSVKIQGSNYVMVEGWQFAGSLFGLMGKAVSYDNKSIYEPIEFTWNAQDWNTKQWVQKKHNAKGTYKYFAEAVMVNAEGREVGKGFAMCSNEEVKKHTFDEYAILSMAQTRAIGKAARMSLSFLIKAAGYEPTPAEEMVDEDVQEAQLKKTELPEDIDNQIYVFTEAQDLADWANEQTKYHRNFNFLDKVKKQIAVLNKQEKK